MTGRVIFLLEEPSMRTLLAEYLPRLIPGWIHGEHFLLVAHEGKSDLDKSIQTKLKAWREPDVRFVIVRDNDNADCKALKTRLKALCQHSQHQVLIRLVCQELESWYLADSQALETAYPAERKNIRRLIKRFSNPDACQKPSRELASVIPAFRKHDAARRMGKLIDAANTRSASLVAFANGVRKLA